MDTPEKYQIATPISKYEDSPVFNYINSLSPIKPVKSIPTDQTFSSLSFASPSSVFTSPHINPQRESRFLRRQQFTDPSKPEFSRRDNDENTSEGVLDAVHQLDYLDPGSSDTGITIDPSNKDPKSDAGLPQSLKYDCTSPEDNRIPHNDIETETIPEVAIRPASHVHFVQGVSKERRQSFEIETELRGICQIGESKEAAGCDWGKLISDDTDQLIFDSSISKEHSEVQDHKTVDPGTYSFIATVLQLPHDEIDDLQKSQSMGSVDSYEQCETEETVTKSRDVGEIKETDQTPAVPSSTLLDKLVVSDSRAEVDDKKGKKCMQSSCKLGSQQQLSIRRRCLLYEMTGAHKKKLIYNSDSGSSASSQSDGKVSSDEKQFMPFKPGNIHPSSMLAGIGLHLNALATTAEDGNKVVKHEPLASERKPISMSRSIPSSNSMSLGQTPLNKSLTPDLLERDLVRFDSEVQATEDASQTSEFGVSEEFNHGSPKRKRRRSEQAAENEACKRCNCKKSKCLKLYCECFAAGLYCVEPCSCQDCFNKPVHEDTVLQTRKQIESRNPLAFAPKVIRSSDYVPEFGDESNKTPASARHKRGCNCKKSSCLKKYCECFQGGVGCSISCRCEGCKNTFGRKDGTEEAELDEEETEETCDKNSLDTSSQYDVVLRGEEEHSDLVPPVTPSSEISRPLVQLPFTFGGGKPPQSSLLSVGSSSQMYTSQKFGPSGFICRLPKFEKHLEMIPEDETPEILQGNLAGGVKSTSPNSKRVSPPHHKIGSTRAWRSGRKLILRSIPSFPSLNPCQESSDRSPGKTQ